MDATPSNDRWFDYDFVATILWIGFLLAISFMEAPLRFQAEAITIPIALQIGRLVFHALNVCELIFAAWIFVCQRLNAPSRNTKRLFYWAAAVLIAQTLLLFLVLDPRTNAIIANENVKETSHHTIYIGLEVLKLIALAFLARSQIRDFKSRIAAAV